VVQTRSIPATGYCRTPGSARITYGALTSHLRPLLAYLGQHPERRRHWHDLLDVDCGRTEVAASLLLCLARRANSEGVMLYGTSNTAHLVRTIGLFAHPPFTDEALDRFEDLLGVTMPRTTPISPEVR
jgi:translation initiation factor 6 (eIF-6)